MVSAIIDTLSRYRFDTYLKAAGFDQNRALNLYLWNAKVGASFHIPLQAVEIALRNRVNYALVAAFGIDWWQEQQFLNILDRERDRDLQTVFSRLSKRGVAIDTNQVVASLSFGFWVGMLQSRYNPALWGAHFKTSFPHLPLVETRSSLFLRVGQIAKLRNRISHHEPLLKENITKQHGDIMRLLSWLCPATAQWVRPHCEVPHIVRMKP